MSPVEHIEQGRKVRAKASDTTRNEEVSGSRPAAVGRTQYPGATHLRGHRSR